MGMNEKKLKIAIAGSSGFIGTHLVGHLESQGRKVYRLVRYQPYRSTTEIHWNHVEGTINSASIDGLDVVINLAGLSLSSGKWTAKNKEIMRGSRVDGTRFLAESIAKLKNPPKLFIAASAIGYYGNRGDEILKEDGRPGEGFLSDLCIDWEESAKPASDAGIRVINLRTSIVLDKNGGALLKMLTTFKLGVGGKIGSGKQYMSWITIFDHVRAIEHIIGNESISGPVNLTSPNPVTNAEFTKTLGRVLRRPTMMPLPAFAIDLMFGEMGRTLLLGSQRVIPEVLSKSGFVFESPDLESGLNRVLSVGRGPVYSVT